jgi:hypothetical protein
MVCRRINEGISHSARVRRGEFQDYVPGASYVAGIDLAKSRDFAALAIIRTGVEPFRLVEFGKLPHIDYTRQVEMPAGTLKRFGNPKALVDSSAAGAAVIELMRKQGLAVEEFTFTNDSKARILIELVVGFEQSTVLLPSSGRTLDETRAVQDLEGELFNFEPAVLRSGGLRYEASSGYHDDLVMALCLAYTEASHPPREPMVEFMEFDPVTPYGDPRESRFRWRSILD